MFEQLRKTCVNIDHESWTLWIMLMKWKYPREYWEEESTDHDIFCDCSRAATKGFDDLNHSVMSCVNKLMKSDIDAKEDRTESCVDIAWWALLCIIGGMICWRWCKTTSTLMCGFYLINRSLFGQWESIWIVFESRDYAFKTAICFDIVFNIEVMCGGLFLISITPTALWVALWP